MKRLRFINLLCLPILTVYLLGCSGLSRQMKASTEGMKIEYHVRKQEIKRPDLPIIVDVIDDRIVKEVVGDGAKSSVGERFAGYFAFGILFAFSPNEPIIQDKENMRDMFYKSFYQRFLNNGIKISKNQTLKHLMLKVYIRSFRLDFRLGKWIGEVGYVAKLIKDNELICEQVVNEKVKKINLYGYGSGEEAISKAFNKAINKLNLCKI